VVLTLTLDWLMYDCNFSSFKLFDSLIVGKHLQNWPEDGLLITKHVAIAKIKKNLKIQNVC
jgi:hypothetical protein